MLLFDQAETVLGIAVPGAASWSRNQIDKLTDWVKRPDIGMKGMVYCKVNEDGTYKSSVDKFYTQEQQAEWAKATEANPGDLILILAGEERLTRKATSDLRLHIAEEMGLRNPEDFAPLWVVDFPLLEWDHESERFHAMHHPFTSPKPEDIGLLEKDPVKVRANAYDLVLNGNEIGGGSIRIHDRALQSRMFDLLGFSKKEAESQFGFLIMLLNMGHPRMEV